MEVYMKNNNTIKLSKEKKDEMISSIKNYFLEERRRVRRFGFKSYFNICYGRIGTGIL
jgi:hypothetical protein